MSRTYRKAVRWMDHYNGDIVNTYRDVSLNNFPKLEEYFGENWHRISELWGISRIFKAVKVADVDCYGRVSCKQVYGLKGNRDSVLKQMEALVEEAIANKQRENVEKILAARK